MRDWPDLVLVARRELAVRMRGTAFRVSTILLLAVTVAGIAIAAALTGHPQRFTVAVAAQSPPTLTAMVRADAKAAGLQVTTVTATDRADAVRLVEQGKATAAVAAGAEIIWKGSPDSTLQPVLAAAVQRAVVTQRAASLGLVRQRRRPAAGTGAGDHHRAARRQPAHRPDDHRRGRHRLAVPGHHLLRQLSC